MSLTPKGSGTMRSINVYSKEYIDECRLQIDLLLITYDNLIMTARERSGADETLIDAAIESFAPHFFNHMVVVLDHYFGQRNRTLERKDGNPLNEVRLLSSSIMENRGKMLADKAISLDPEKSVLKLGTREDIKLSRQDFERIFTAFLAEIESKYTRPDL